MNEFGDDIFRDLLMAEMHTRKVMSAQELLDFINPLRAKNSLPPVTNAFEEVDRVIFGIPHFYCGEIIEQKDGKITCPDCGSYDEFWLKSGAVDRKLRWGIVLPIDLEHHQL